MARETKARERILVALHALYAQIPGIDCQRRCGGSCGPIAMDFLEWTELRNHAPLGLKGKSGQCPLLRQGVCTAYPYRPLICRLWGTVPALRCHHGCEPERWLTDEECVAILREGERLSQLIFPGQPPRHTHTPTQVRAVADQAAEEFVTRRMFWHSTAERLEAAARGAGLGQRESDRYR